MRNRCKSTPSTDGCVKIWGAYLVCRFQSSGTYTIDTVRLVHAGNADSIEAEAAKANSPDNTKVDKDIWIYVTCGNSLFGTPGMLSRGEV